MKKRLISLLTALCLMAALLPTALAAGTTSKLNAIQALGILSGDGAGNLNLGANVTRAQFAVMLARASSFHDSLEGTAGALYKDVKSGHWAGAYIKLAAEQGWMTGYSDATFRPNNPVTLEEGCTSLLRLLGYDTSTFTGSYPQAQLSKAHAVGLMDGVSAAQGKALTRNDCVSLFYNLLAAKNASGAVYGTTLGYTVTNGEVDYASLVSNDTKGPFIAEADGSAALSFSANEVYIDTAAGSLKDVKKHDVYYYNENLRTVWIYTRRVTGTLTAIAPNQTAPMEVTVSGVSYDIETSEAAYLFSDQGSFRVGDVVTLLLGMDGEVAGVKDAAETSGVFYGVVTSSRDETVQQPDGTSQVKRMILVYCTDGVERSFEAGKLGFTAGTTVLIDYSAGQPVSYLPTRRLSGSFTAASFAGIELAGNVEIIDTDRYGGAARVYPSRLSGTELELGSVVYYLTNAQGKISHLILRDATGDASTYGLVTSAQESKSGTISGSYRFLIDGKENSYSTSGSILHVEGGAARIIYDTDGKIKQAVNLKRLKSPALKGKTMYAEDRRHEIVEDTQIYILRDGKYYEADLDSVREGYNLTAYADDLGYPAGNAVRVLVAEEK